MDAHTYLDVVALIKTLFCNAADMLHFAKAHDILVNLEPCQCSSAIIIDLYSTLLEKLKGS